jgi:phosphodiesterase/alkaline phosphatase D-like protein
VIVWRDAGLDFVVLAKVAETLNEFRGRHRYNLLDENVRGFNAEVPQIWQWDDHEVTNNWSDSKNLAVRKGASWRSPNCSAISSASACTTSSG